MPCCSQQAIHTPNHWAPQPFPALLAASILLVSRFLFISSPVSVSRSPSHIEAPIPRLLADELLFFPIPRILRLIKDTNSKHRHGWAAVSSAFCGRDRMGVTCSFPLSLQNSGRLIRTSTSWSGFRPTTSHPPSFPPVAPFQPSRNGGPSLENLIDTPTF